MIVLDLSRNQFKSEIGILLGRIIEEHGKRRELIKDNENVALAGLCEINLNKCGIKTAYLKDLLLILSKDTWIKSLGLSQNYIVKCLDEEGIKMLDQMLEYNGSLISLDLRKNPGFNEEWSKQIYEKLVKNLNELQQKKSKKKKKKQDSDKKNEKEDQEIEDKTIKQNKVVDEIVGKTIKSEKNQEVVQFGSLDLKCNNCQRIQSDSLRLQYEGVNLQMQLRQLNEQLYKSNDEEGQGQLNQEEIQEYEGNILEMIDQIQTMMQVLETQKFGIQEIQS